MAYRRLLVLASLCVAAACRPATPLTIIVLDGRQPLTVSSSSRVPRQLLAASGVMLEPADVVLLDGYPVDPDKALPAPGQETIQVRRGIRVTINGQTVTTAASTVGEALAKTGKQLYVSDSASQPLDAPLKEGSSLTYEPSRPILITGDGANVPIRSAAPTVGSGLAQAGLPIVGLDTTLPAPDQPMPDTGTVQIMRISESLILADESIPYGSTFQDSAQTELGTQQILQPGLPGLAVTRTRVRYEDGLEVSRKVEPQAIVRPPQQRLVARGTKIVAKSATIDGATIQYWYVMKMYATVYSPCNSGVPGGGCSYGTASGLRVGKGVVAVDPALYAYLNGQRLYIPGYGHAVVGDVGGGYLVERNLGISRYKWIDLGFDDNNLQDMTGWVTVYFLAPAPAFIPDVLK